MLIFTQTGLVLTLKATATWMNGLEEDFPQASLFANDVVPTEDTILSDLDVPADDDGLSVAKDLINWDVDGVEYMEPRAILTHPSVTWIVDSVTTYTIYGYLVTAGGGLLYAERFAAPVVLDEVGKSLTIRPVYTRANEYTVS